MWHERDISKIRFVAIDVNCIFGGPSRKSQTQAERRRGQRPEAVRNARSKRSGER